jgi:hypothetical protein
VWWWITKFLLMITWIWELWLKIWNVFWSIIFTMLAVISFLLRYEECEILNDQSSLVCYTHTYILVVDHLIRMLTYWLQGSVKHKLSARGKYVSVNIGPVQVVSSEQVFCFVPFYLFLSLKWSLSNLFVFAKYGFILKRTWNSVCYIV